VTEQKTTSSIEDDITLNRHLAVYDYDSIRGNGDLSEVARLRKLSEAYEEHKEKHKELLAKARQERERHKEEARQALFSPPIPKSVRGGERETFLLSLRDASERTRTIAKEPGGLEALAEQARISRDELLAHQVFVQALSQGKNPITESYHPTVDNYLQERPGLQEAFQTYTRDENDLLQRAFTAHPPPKPPELAGRRGDASISSTR
jgi:hypothetical protein